MSLIKPFIILQYLKDSLIDAGEGKLKLSFWFVNPDQLPLSCPPKFHLKKGEQVMTYERGAIEQYPNPLHGVPT